MSYPLASQSSVIPSSNQIPPPTYSGDHYPDGNPFQMPTGHQEYDPPSQLYSLQNAPQLGTTTEGARNPYDFLEPSRDWINFVSRPRAAASDQHKPMESTLGLNPLMSTPGAAASPCPATADVLQLSRRRPHQAWTTLPDGPSGNRKTDLFPHYSTVADSRRTFSNPVHGSHLFSPSGRTEASRKDLATGQRHFSEPSALGLAASNNHTTNEFPVVSSGLNSIQQQALHSQPTLDSQQSLDFTELPNSQPSFNISGLFDDQQSLTEFLNSEQPIDAPYPSIPGDHSHLEANQANLIGDEYMPYSLENRISTLSPSDLNTPQVVQSPKDLEKANQCSVESPTIRGWDDPKRISSYGQQNVSHRPKSLQSITLPEGVNPKKRGREELNPVDVEEFEKFITKPEVHPAVGLDFAGDSWMGLDHPTKALPWEADDLENQPQPKRPRLGNGNDLFVENTLPEHEDGPSATYEQQTDPDSNPGFANGNFASFIMPPAVPYPGANLRPKKNHRAVKKRISRSVKNRTHGDLVQQADGSYLFREFGRDDWEPTEYHETLRQQMINFMSRYGEYDDPPAAGPGRNDKTAFEPSQAEWTFNGHQGWHSSQDYLMYRFERGDHRDPDYEPGPLRFQGFVILSKNNEVITGWEDMPLTISSSIEGGRIENIQRMDSRIAIEDFQDRMPSTVSGKPVQGRSAFTNRTMRYRLDNGLASWQPRDGSLVIKRIMLRHLTRGQLEHNTTRGYPGLTEAEKAEIRNDNEQSGRYRSRAGKKALPRQ